MNKNRKQVIKTYTSILQDVLQKLDNVLDEERDYYDNMPENLQGSLRADASQDAIDELEEAIADIGSAIDHLINI